MICLSSIIMLTMWSAGVAQFLLLNACMLLALNNNNSLICLTENLNCHEIKVIFQARREARSCLFLSGRKCHCARVDFRELLLGSSLCSNLTLTLCVCVCLSLTVRV